MDVTVKSVLEMILRDLIREQSEGEWDDKMIEKDVKAFRDKLEKTFDLAIKAD